jgi:hypothetical protein
MIEKWTNGVDFFVTVDKTITKQGYRKMNALEMWTNGVDFVIAETLEEAKEITIKKQGFDINDAKDCISLEYEGWKLCDKDKNFTLRNCLTGLVKDKKKVDDWIKERGKGYFAFFY